MRKEIARQRQIMGNSALIQEKKNYTVNLGEGGCCKVDKECASTQKDNITKKSDGMGDATRQGGDPFTKNTSKNIADAQKDNIKGDNKPVMEGEEVLGWNPDEEYLDTDTETEIGDADPFVEECASMHNSENQNCPSVGTSEVGDGDPFDEELQVEGEEGEELIDDYESEEMTDVDADFDGDEEIDSDDVEGDEEIDADDVDFESDLEDMTDEASEEEEFDGDIETRLSAIEGLLRQLADKMGVSTFDDDDLYDDENEELNDEDEFADEESEDEEDIEVFESINFRKAMLSENDYFGKHPAYEKEPMILPSNNHDEKEGYYDMNDESVENEDEYGQEIGDSEPFEIDVESIENAIAESIQRIVKKK
jgi:hypothetical protein